MKRLHISHSELTASKHGEIYYLHSENKNRSSALDAEESSEILISIPRSLGATALKIDIFDEKCQRRIKSIAGVNDGYSGALEIYKVSFPQKVLTQGLYFYKIVISTVVGNIFANGCREEIWFSKKEAGFFQLSVSKFSDKTPEELLGGVIYHIFVDRFSKDEKTVAKPGTVIAENWDIIPEYPEYPGAFMKNNTFYGGSLDSAREKLDYIKSLGTNIIYLSPVFESPSNHKYDTADYLSVDSMFGGDDALKNFIDEAKKRGIAVILDGVFNHTGADSIYFNRYGNYPTLGAYQSLESEYYGWYDFKSHPDDYESWWGIKILPRINTGNPDFEDFILNKVIKKYRDMGIAGMRLDVADELSDDFIKKIKTALSENGRSILYGEVWEDGSNKISYGKRKKYYLGEELDGVMNYPLRSGLIDFFRNRDTGKLRYALTDIINNAPKRIRDMQMNILGTHDTERILTALGGKSPEGKTNSELSVLKMSREERLAAEKKLLSAYTVLVSLPGIPAIFYGDEAGLEGYSDPFNRMPYPNKVSKKILNHYKKIGQIRKNNKVYSDGEYKLITLDSDVLAFSRFKDGCSYITVSNNSEKDMVLEFSTSAEELISNIKQKKHNLPKNSTGIFKTSDDEFSMSVKRIKTEAEK